jgi:hypothetical protein
MSSVPTNSIVEDLQAALAQFGEGSRWESGDIDLQLTPRRVRCRDGCDATAGLSNRQEFEALPRPNVGPSSTCYLGEVLDFIRPNALNAGAWTLRP